MADSKEAAGGSRSLIAAMTIIGLAFLAASSARGQPQNSIHEVAVREDSIRFRSGEVELRGMLRLPDGEGPFPAVLLLPGGGRQYLTLEPDYWAGRLLEEGFATLVYHKRGTGDSGGDWASATFEDFIGDAGAAVETLRRHPLIEGRIGGCIGGRIGVMGFSQGGRLAPVVASRYRLDAAVSISGPQISVVETRLYALRNAMREAGMPEENLELAMSLWREFLEQRARASGTAGTAGFDDSAGSDGADVGANPEPSPALDARIVGAAERLPARALPPTSDSYQSIPIFNSLGFDPTADLARLDVPWLVMYGEDDITVPVAASVEALRAVFDETGYTGLELIVIPGIGHGLSVDPTTRHPLYEKKPAAWLAEKLRGPEQ